MDNKWRFKLPERGNFQNFVEQTESAVLSLICTNCIHVSGEREHSDWAAQAAVPPTARIEPLFYILFLFLSIQVPPFGQQVTKIPLQRFNAPQVADAKKACDTALAEYQKKFKELDPKFAEIKVNMAGRFECEQREAPKN